MLNNLSLVIFSMSNFFGIDATTVISPILSINFAKIHTDSEVVRPMT